MLYGVYINVNKHAHVGSHSVLIYIAFREMSWSLSVLSARYFHVHFDAKPYQESGKSCYQLAHISSGFGSLMAA